MFSIKKLNIFSLKIVLVFAAILCSNADAAEFDLFGNSIRNYSKQSFVISGVTDSTKRSLTEINIGMNFSELRQSVAKAPDVWLKKTRWNEVWLEKFNINFDQKKSGNRLVFGTTLRYRTYTKNIFKPSRRWRTASYLTRLKGSFAVNFNAARGELVLTDFKTDLIDLKNFPGWVENWLKKKINKKITAKMPLNFKAKGLNGSKYALKRIRKKGDFLFFDVGLKPAINLEKAVSIFSGDTQALLARLQPRLIKLEQRTISLHGDLKYRGDNRHFLADGYYSYGLNVEFAKIRGVKGLSLEYSYNKKNWKLAWTPGWKNTDYNRFVLGETVYGGSKRNLKPGSTVYIRAAYLLPNKKKSSYFIKPVKITDYRLKAPSQKSIEVVNSFDSGIVANVKFHPNSSVKYFGNYLKNEVQISYNNGRSWKPLKHKRPAMIISPVPETSFSGYEGDAVTIHGSASYGSHVYKQYFSDYPKNYRATASNYSQYGNWIIGSLNRGNFLIKVRKSTEVYKYNKFRKQNYRDKLYGPWSRPIRIKVETDRPASPQIAAVRNVSGRIQVNLKGNPLFPVQVEVKPKNQKYWYTDPRYDRNRNYNLFGDGRRGFWNFLNNEGRQRVFYLKRPGGKGIYSASDKVDVRVRYIIRQENKSDYITTNWSRSFSYAMAVQNKTEYLHIKGVRYKIEKYKDGKIKTRTPIVNNRNHGIQEQFHPNSKIKTRVPFVNGRIHGVIESYNQNGKLISKTEFRNGKRIRSIPVGKTDHRIAKYPNGRVRSRTPYVNGRPHGIQINYFSNGKISSRVQFANGYRNGYTYENYPDGRLRQKTPFKQNRVHGIMERYAQNGKCISKAEYRDGRMIRRINQGRTSPNTNGNWQKVSVLVNDGKGDRRTKKKGGNILSIPFSSLNNNSVIRVKVVSGNYSYITVHARYRNGQWRVIYRGRSTQFPYQQYFRRYASAATSLIFQVNGSYERFDPKPCRVEILKK